MPIGKNKIKLSLISLFISCLCFACGPHASDKAIIDAFTQNEDKFYQMIDMFEEDSPAKRINPTGMSPKDVISGERWEEYKKIFRELNFVTGMHSIDSNKHPVRRKGENIYFSVTARGLMMGGSSKGLIYKPEHHTSLYDNLDKRPKDLPRNGTGFRKIKEDWYIVYTSYD